MAYEVTPAQSAQYESEGYFIARRLLEPENVHILKREITTVLTHGQEGLDFDNTRMDGQSIKGPGMYRKLALLGRRNPLVWQTYYTHPNVLDVNRSFLGDEVFLWFDSIFTKPARIGEATPWHQDIGLWTNNPAQKPKMPHFKRALTIWMAIDKADQTNGCLQVSPGTHKGPVVSHMRYDDSIHPELPRDQVQNLTVHHIELEAGDAIVWHAHLWHYSPINTSDRNRLGIAQVTLSQEDALAVEFTHLPALLKEGEGQAAPIKETETAP